MHFIYNRKLRKPFLILVCLFEMSVFSFAQNDNLSELRKDTFEQTIDSIIQMAIDSMAFPGAQLLIVKNGETLLKKAYGHHTYDKNRVVRLEDLYDLASVTKVTTGLPVLMKLYDEGKFDLDAPLKQYLPEFKNSNKANLTFREMLAHQAQLKPYIVYWQKTLKKNGKYKWCTIKSKKSKRFPIYISDQLYLHRKYKKKIYKAIKRSELNKEKGYRYSGLLFLLLPDIIENITQTDFEKYLYGNFYQPLGAKTLTYNPYLKFPKDQIVPTERDTLFRKILVHGTVHDEAAVMLDGVSCNAGLFGNAEDLGKLFQMYLNGGTFEEKRYLSTEVINEFTNYQYAEFDNRRGLGFDKPLLEYDSSKAYIAKSASPQSFGHSGFTGIFVWADPANNLLVVLLTNRVYPYRSQRKLYALNIRPLLHQTIYDYVDKKI